MNADENKEILETERKYSEILHAEHHQSPTRKRMTMYERAAQFSSFAALSGYEDAIDETGEEMTARMNAVLTDDDVNLSFDL